MKVRNVVLSGVAAIALAGAFAAPGFAQYAGNPPQVSTPEEKAQTQQLNQSAQDGTTVSPKALNGDPDGATIDQAHRDTTNAQYQQQQQDYQDRKATYDAQRDQYERDIHRYDEARYYYTDYPHAYRYRFGQDDKLRQLYLIADPTHQIANAPVEGRNGEWVGRVRNTETAPDGRPLRVEIALNRRVSVWVSPDHLRFDAADHVIFTDLSRADLWNMPGRRFEG